MAYFNEKTQNGSASSTAEARTPNDGARTPRTGSSTPRHPSQALLQQLPVPSSGWHDDVITPVSGMTTARTSRRNSFTSMRSMGSFAMMEDIKHEVMANFLFQQQCGKLWISDVSGELEGILLRKTRGNYLACPPALGQSPFAFHCSQMNLNVSTASPFLDTV
jgi:hypothetical protein